MENLLQMYSVKDILMFLVMFALAAKGVITFFDWVVARVKKAFNKEQIKISKEEEVQERLQKGSDIMHELGDNQKKFAEVLDKLEKKVDLLIDSNKDDIKAFLTKEHHYFCYQVGWIDDYSLECCERRFAHYQQEGGNSFIEGFMKELRDLPKQPPASIEVKLDK